MVFVNVLCSYFFMYTLFVNHQSQSKDNSAIVKNWTISHLFGLKFLHRLHWKKLFANIIYDFNIEILHSIWWKSETKLMIIEYYDAVLYHFYLLQIFTLINLKKIKFIFWIFQKKKEKFLKLRKIIIVVKSRKKSFENLKKRIKEKMFSAKWCTL